MKNICFILFFIGITYSMHVPDSMDKVVADMKNMLNGTFPAASFSDWASAAERILSTSEKPEVKQMAIELERIRTKEPRLSEAPGIVATFISGMKACDSQFGVWQITRVTVAVPSIISNGTIWYRRSAQEIERPDA